ncbi:hypothetical protein [Thalassotalea sp. SU-HH00458]|uniref:hypothetical protein n=1 Tax=Thalassotalea sp. SU-HH00458 TaxID=3127657 RepID=UPI003106264B
MNNLLRVYAKEHPTLLLSICYFIVTIIGVIYSYFYYAEFGIEILKFADLSDYLLASILEPLSIVVFVFWVIFYLLSFKLELWARKKFNGYGRFVERTMKPKYSDPILFCLAIIVITVIFVKNLAIDNTLKIKAGNFDDYSALLPNDKDEQKLAFLGSSSRFSFFYDLDLNEAIVIPVESIAYMKKKLPIESVKAQTEKESASENDTVK